MQWTDDKQIHIHTVLHQNKNDEHARGHIGTELNNKAETILQVEVDKEDKAISVVEAVHIRDRDFEPFAFRINEDVLPELVEPYLRRPARTGRTISIQREEERATNQRTVRSGAGDSGGCTSCCSGCRFYQWQYRQLR